MSPDEIPVYHSAERLKLLDELAFDINNWAEDKGFQALPFELQALCASSHPVKKFVDLLVRTQKMALITTEVSELVEGLRKPVDTGSDFTNEEEEAADILIRLLNYCGQNGLRIGAAVVWKMAKNEGRPHKHGKEF